MGSWKIEVGSWGWKESLAVQQRSSVIGLAPNKTPRALITAYSG